MNWNHFWRIAWKALPIFGIFLLVLSILFIAGEYRRIESHLGEGRWVLPSTIYARAPLLRPGMRITPDWLVDYLQRLNYQKVSGELYSPAQYSITRAGITFRNSFEFGQGSRKSAVLVSFNKKGIAKIRYSNSDQSLSYYQLEPAPITDLFGGQWEKRLLLPLREIPASLQNAVIAIEDRRFYQHSGVDVRAILRASWHNLHRSEDLQGASTITQQLVKNFYLTPERSLRRKISEAFLSLILEDKLDKKQILTLYLNEVYMGQRGAMSINGMGAASRLYFHKVPKNLTLAESALLAGMIRAPNLYNPYRHPDEAKERRNEVLGAMKEMNFITANDYRSAKEAPVKIYPLDTRINLAPYFGDVVKQQLSAKFKSDDLHSKNYHVFTTIDLDMQEAAEQALNKGLEQIDKIRFKRVKKEAQGCLIAIDPTGQIRAFVGGRSYSESQFNRIAQSARQPGSAFKPVVYAAALEQAFYGIRKFTPATLIADEPVVFKFQNVQWEPRNYDGQYHGIVPLRIALAESLNVPTAKLAENVGLHQIVNLAQAMGLKNVRPYPSLALGVFEVSPWQLAESYTAFANNGMRTELQAIERVTDAKGETIDLPQPRSVRVIHPETAYLITDMLKTAMTSGTAAVSQRMGFTKPAAGKTGTTNDFRDAWFIGYTPHLICLVWTGYDDNSSIGMNGAQAALPIWIRFMKAATGRDASDDFKRPGGIIEKEIDVTTGKLAGSLCTQVATEIFIAGTEPTEPCLDSDHYAPSILDFSSNPVVARQVMQEENEVPAPADSSSDTSAMVQEPVIEEDSSQHVYIAPDPDVHAILTGDDSGEEAETQTQTQPQ